MGSLYVNKFTGEYGVSTSIIQVETTPAITEFLKSASPAERASYAYRLESLRMDAMDAQAFALESQNAAYHFEHRNLDTGYTFENKDEELVLVDRQNDPDCAEYWN